jgi:hypothetical protein
LSNNTIIPLNGTSFKTFQIGSLASEEYVAQNVEFRSNKMEGRKMEIDATDQDHSYSVYWTLTVNVVDQDGNPVNGAEVQVLDKDGKEMLSRKTTETGIISEELMEYDFRDYKKTFKSPYKIITGDSSKIIDLDENMEITVVM